MTHTDNARLPVIKRYDAIIAIITRPLWKLGKRSTRNFAKCYLPAGVLRENITRTGDNRVDDQRC